MSEIRVRPCGLQAPTCDSVCSEEEWLRCADSHCQDIPQHIKDRIAKQKEE